MLIETIALRLYETYNAGGSDPNFVNKNFRGDPCPAWADLPVNVREKWIAVAVYVEQNANPQPVSNEPEGDFGWAIKQMQLGHKVCRAGWNGKKMWVAITPGSQIGCSQARAGAAQHRADEITGHGFLRTEGPIIINPHIDMRAADGTLVIGWLASQTDMLATDWQIVV